jgi:hypothetical protein
LDAIRKYLQSIVKIDHAKLTNQVVNLITHLNGQTSSLNGDLDLLLLELLLVGTNLVHAVGGVLLLTPRHSLDKLVFSPSLVLG